MRKLKTIFNHLIHYGLNFVYPPLCLGCETHLKNGRLLFCKGCSGFFELINPMGRCLYCFKENLGSRPCSECIEKKRWNLKIASALDYLEPVSSLVKSLKYGHMPYLAKTASAFMAAQFFRLNWPVPDLIIPVPRRHWFQGANHAALIGLSLAERLNAKSLPLLKRRAGDFSQTRVSKKEREQLLSTRFYLKNPLLIEGKNVLLVDDVVTTGTTLHICAQVLSQAYPKQMFALTLARTCI